MAVVNAEQAFGQRRRRCFAVGAQRNEFVVASREWSANAKPPRLEMAGEVHDAGSIDRIVLVRPVTAAAEAGDKVPLLVEPYPPVPENCIQRFLMEIVGSLASSFEVLVRPRRDVERLPSSDVDEHDTGIEVWDVIGNAQLAPVLHSPRGGR